MIISEPASLLRLIGVGVVAASTVVAICLAINFVSGSDPYGTVLLFAPFAWMLTTLGEWLWSFESGWHGLRRVLRVLQITSIMAALFVPIMVSLVLLLLA